MTYKLYRWDETTYRRSWRTLWRRQPDWTPVFFGSLQLRRAVNVPDTLIVDGLEVHDGFVTWTESS